MTCPAIGSATRNRPATASTMVQPGSTAAAKAMGKNAAMMPPMNGTNRIRPAKIPHSTALGTPMIHKPSGNEHAEAGIEKGLHQKEAAESAAGIIEGRGRALKVGCAGEPQEAVADVLSLQQDEDEEEHHQCRHRQR